jgi:hypothetical protein
MQENMTLDPVKSLAVRLPALSESDVEFATTNTALSWAIFWLSEENVGLVQVYPEYGLTMQGVTTKMARCIMVVDNPECLLTLQQMRATFRFLNAELEVGTCTVIRDAEISGRGSEGNLNTDSPTSPADGATAVIGMEVA